MKRTLARAAVDCLPEIGVIWVVMGVTCGLMAALGSSSGQVLTAFLLFAVAGPALDVLARWLDPYE